MLTLTVPQPHAEETSLYYVSSADARGDDMSAIVEAQTPQDAVRMWRQSYEFLSSARPDIVFQIPSIKGIPRALNWSEMPAWTGWHF